MNTRRTAAALLLALAAPLLPGHAVAEAAAHEAPLLAIQCAFEEAAIDSVEIVAAASSETGIDYSARILARLGAPRDLHCRVRPHATPGAAPADGVPANVFASVQTALI